MSHAYLKLKTRNWSFNLKDFEHPPGFQTLISKDISVIKL